MRISFQLFLIVTLPLWIILRVFRVRNMKTIGAKKLVLHEIAVNLLFIYLLYLSEMTVFPLSLGIPFERSYNLEPFKTIMLFIPGLLKHGLVNDMYGSGLTVSAVNIVGNIVVFVPIGMLIPLVGNKLKHLKNIFLLGFVISLLIEGIQFLFVQGRSMDVDDLILNTLGAILGWIFYLILKFLIGKLFKKSI